MVNANLLTAVPQLQEDPSMILASNTEQHKEKHRHIGTRQKIEKQTGEEKQRPATQMLLEKAFGLCLG